MLWILISVLVLSAFAGYMLFAPLCIEINTEGDLYRIRFHRLAALSLVPVNDSLAVELKMLFWKRRFHLFREEVKGKTVRQGAVQKKKRQRTVPWRKIRAVMRSFRVPVCHVSVNTGDMQLNGILYPLFYWAARYTGKDIRIRFSGETKVLLKIQNNLARMVRAFITS